MHHVEMLKKRLNEKQIEAARNQSKVENAIHVLRERYGTSNLKIIKERFEAEKRQAEERATLIEVGQKMAHTMLNTIDKGEAVKDEHLEKARALIGKIESMPC